MLLDSSASKHPIFKMTTLFDYLTKDGKKVHSLRVGAPSEHLRMKCGELIHKATLALHTPENYPQLFQYGPHSGSLAAKSELTKFLTEEYGDTVNCDDIWFTAGASQGLACIGSLLFQPKTVAFVEEPTYFLALKALSDDFGMNLVGVPTDQDGLIVDELEKLMAEHLQTLPVITERNPFSGLLYCIPTFNNPNGSVLSVTRCKQLIKLLRKYNVLAFCDDVYNLLSYDGEKPPFKVPPRLFSFDNKADPDYKGNVISNGTFSKLLGPGLRLGWMEVPEHVRKILKTSGYITSGGCFNHYTSCVVTMAIQMGLVKEHVAYTRELYKSQLNTLCSAMDKYFPRAIKYTKPQGGYFVWVVLPPEIDCDKLYDICFNKYAVDFNKGSRCSCKGQYKNCMRLSFAFLDSPTLEHCVKQIALAIEEIFPSN